MSISWEEGGVERSWGLQASPVTTCSQLSRVSFVKRRLLVTKQTGNLLFVKYFTTYYVAIDMNSVHTLDLTWSCSGEVVNPKSRADSEPRYEIPSCDTVMVYRGTSALEDVKM